MPDKPFLDTSIIVYAFTSNDPRSERADELLAAGGVINVQVLSEFVCVLRGKQRRSWEEIESALHVLRVLLDPAQALTVDIHDFGLEIARKYEMSIYDSMIVAAALRAGCSTLYSEDFQHGQTIERLTIRNPFRS